MRDAAFDEIAERVPAGDEIGLRKTSAYLNWRYVGAPGRTYRILRAEGRGRLRGAAVLRLNPAPGGRAWLVDLICDSRDVEAVAALVSASVRELRRRRAGDVKTFTSSTRVRRVLARHGFVATSETPQFTYRVESEALRPLLDGVVWNFWWGDGDSELL